ncbi:hypothetical protein KEM55_000174 [Ascosphaera atra]|nr:hypothetical protein KEM55_000174 [Ascosphaera atra]
MRCDQSLLGGEWTNFANAEFPAIKEPTFAVFVMLEAVRLVKPENNALKRLDEGKNALVIGLGIGTTPIALAAHGINTTVVEIDRAVVDLAKEHFGIPAANLHIAIDDAISFVDDRLQLDDVAQKYDYIVHDVFTGGVEPSALFTRSFLLNLRSLLKEDGIIAIVGYMSQLDGVHLDD